MSNLLNSLLVIVLMLNLFALGTSRIASVIRTVAMQGALLGALPLLLHGHASSGAVLAAALTIALKGVVIPGMMTRALRDVKIKREVEPLIGFQASVILGALGTVCALLFAGRLPLAAQHAGTLMVPTAVATVLTGFILLITRFKALTQVMGYLVLENGIYIFGMLLVEAMPLVVEMGVLLDLFVAIFVICIIVNRINQAFSSLDTRRLASLKE
ncbi:MAG: hydrogenase [Kiritimatiellae bacterium]|jgi:hydrogenase-4 component E|nr:hydrogenase [Kiritimatiellia bacterium]NLF99529.1 hydrogenase [Lentisphaerota bacterium]